MTGLEWSDFKLEIPKNIHLETSEYRDTFIKINTAYKWGSGWNSQEAIIHSGSGRAAADAFYEEVYGKLRDAGFQLIPSDIEGSCPTLTDKKFGAEKMSLYLHPMEFTGYATQAQIDAITALLEECETVNFVQVIRNEPVYFLPDCQYREILQYNAKEIARYAAEHYRPGWRCTGQVGFDFASEARLPRYGQGSAKSSDDVDIQTVNDICRYAKDFEYFIKLDKEKERRADEHER